MFTQHTMLAPTVEKIVAEVNTKRSEVTRQKRDIFLVAVTAESADIGHPDIYLGQTDRGFSFLHIRLGSADFGVRAFSRRHTFLATAALLKFGNTWIQIERGGQGQAN